MTNRFVTLAAAAAFCLSLSSPALAADYVPLGNAGGWNISSDGSVCAGSQDFTNDTALTFIISAKGKAVIFIQNNAWNIPKGDYSALVSVDRGNPTVFAGMAEGKVVALPWQLRADQVTMMSSGKLLKITVGTQAYSYMLDGSAAMLAALGRCAGSLMNAANPFAGVAGMPSSSNPFAGN
ncbi:hypothetical protein SAE02_76420 [Skermanella aerolata]|uniref:Uncharacterized protein n=1 Tax=Skermanella aerolata TaxID=393310 RepID=A0A512E428_9PROT|nr:hypothetical protein [Skermanella aerolata]KJB90004.1 hypothetical protein N826_08700 [Skermanella aerolata KACC 11604]GEO43494.1 hypothetical protein SAE02_76420 [Skermanella aerolata]